MLNNRKKLINSQKNKMSPIWQLKFSQSPEIELAKNVSLKIYNYLYVTLQTKLFAELQGSITTMSDKELSDMFEIATTTEKLKQQLSNLELIRNRYTEQENTFKSVTSTFSKTNPKTIEF